jgi:hypothetical protein
MNIIYSLKFAYLYNFYDENFLCDGIFLLFLCYYLNYWDINIISLDSDDRRH